MKLKAILASLLALASPSFAAEGGYTIVVSKATHDDAKWKPVVETLVKKHEGEVLTYAKDVSEVLPKLRESFPKHTCFVATPEESTRKFVAIVHQMTRVLDDDPYTDTMWGILTGYDAACALRIAQTEKPLTINKVASGTEV